MKILICGLPGSGKTTLAQELAKRLRAVVWDGDEVRAKLTGWDFDAKTRLAQAERMAWLCERVTAHGIHAIAAFICPTMETRNAFGADFLIWIDRNGSGRWANTQATWEDPERWDLRVTNAEPPEYWADRAAKMIHDKILGHTRK